MATIIAPACVIDTPCQWGSATAIPQEGTTIVQRLTHRGLTSLDYATVLAAEVPHYIARALAEDIGDGDVTTQATIPADLTYAGTLLAKATGIVAGLDVARQVFLTVDPAVTFTPHVSDGDAVTPGTALATVAGPARALLTAERVALNFLQRMSGIATLTRRYVDAVVGTHAIILDTRKTVPGLRYLDKWAVVLGGGHNHRIGLFDMALIKDNHITAAGGITAAVARVRTMRHMSPSRSKSKTWTNWPRRSRWM